MPLKERKKLLHGGGPCTTPNDLELCIQNKPNLAENTVKTKLSYYVHTNKAERHIEQTLKIMIPHDEGLENLLVVLGDNKYLATLSHASVLDLPTNADLSKILDYVTEDTQ